jgi:steroid 5-alpha reductase family enzyme
MAEVLINLAACAGVVVVFFGAVFAISVRWNRHDVIDVAWGVGFTLVAITTFLLSAGTGDLATRVLLTVLTVVWGVRLAVHIGLRNRGRPEDPRYVEIRARGGGRHPYLHLARAVYGIQALVLYIVSLPVQIGQYGAGAPGWLLALGAAIWLLGFGFESIGDFQLRRFAADPANKGRVLDTGLWRYTRHPNYFGDANLWWGLYLLACGTWAGAATLPAPLLMTYVLAKGTGKPLTERNLGDRPGYADYIRRTSGFLPLPPRR